MANKAISELPQAQNVNNQDLFVLEQSGIAKKLPAETFITEQGIINALAEALDGHGGITSVTLSSVSGRIRTYRITFTDQSATTFQVYDGTSIDRISRTSSSGLDDVYTIFLSDGTTTFFTVHNGADGDVSEAMLNDALKDKAPAITETTESSAIANFTDGADDLVMHNVVAEINPVQDLTYGDPYPAGSGKNKFQVTATSGVANGVTITVNDDGSIKLVGTVTGDFYLALNENLSLESASWIFSGEGFGSLTGSDGGVFASSGTSTTGDAIRNRRNGDYSFSGTVGRIWLYFNNGTVLNNTLKLMIRPSSIADNTWQPYSNICPITGWTGVNVTRCGKLYDSYLDETVAANGLTIKKSSNHRIKISGTVTGQVDRYLSTAFVGTGETLNLYITQPVPYTNTVIYVYDTTSGTVALRIYGNTQTSGSFTTVTGHSYRVGILCPNDGKTYDMDFTVSVTGTPPETFAISWQTEAGTVYGGTIDMATGLLTVNRAIVDLGTPTFSLWNSTSVRDCYSFIFADIKPQSSNAENINALSTIFVATSYNASWKPWQMSYTNTTKQVVFIVPHGEYATPADFAAAMSGVQFCYELATPQTYQLTPQEVKTLLGTNNVWADTGNVSVTYAADTKMFIEKLTMPTEDDLVANQAITSGKYFMVGNSLYLALANIASGAQITIGTNAQRVSLADALNTINS